MLLALDTSTPLVSVALHDDGRVLHAATSELPMKHGEQMAPMIAAALDAVGAIRQDVTAVATGVGPGPFTGLRVGIVTARTMGLALGIPVYGASSLDVLAIRAIDEGAISEPFLATIDARRKELFWASYDEQGRRLGGPHVDRPLDLPSLPVIGAGPVLYPDSLAGRPGPQTPDAATLARAVAEERVELFDPEPIYLRRPDATVPGPPKKVS